MRLSGEVGKKIKLLHWPLDERSDPDLIDSTQRMLVNVGMLKTPIPAHKLYDETLLEEVLEERKK